MSSYLKSILQPVEQATGLPNQHYINPKIHQLEKKSLFFNTWAGLSVAAAVPNVGDAKPITFFEIPLLIIRDRNHDIRVFQNINLPKISLIECRLETGRTHQIRVHMNYKGNSIIGDKSYGKSKRKFKKIDLNVEKKITNLNRQALHAKSLGFIHPTTKKEVFFEVKRPKDLDHLIKNLNKASI